MTDITPPKPEDLVENCNESDTESLDEAHESGAADCSDDSDLASTGPAASGDQTQKNSRTYHSWSKEESALLESLVREHGCYRKWTLIAKQLPGRTGKQCRDRWNNHLRPGLKQGSWSAEEDYVLAYWHTKRGGSWAAIAFWLPGRTAVAIKNHWNAVNKLSEKGGKDTVLTTYVGLLRSGLSREDAYAQSVKKIGLPAEWSAVLDQTLEASKYDNQASLLPPKWEEILRSKADAKRPHAHGAPVTYTGHIGNQHFHSHSVPDSRHTILHPFAAASNAISTSFTHQARPPTMQKIPQAHTITPKAHAPRELSDCSSPSSGSSETDHALLVKSQLDVASNYLSLTCPHSRTSSPSSGPCDTPSAHTSHDLGLMNPSTTLDCRGPAPYQTRDTRGHMQSPSYSSADLDFVHPSDYLFPPPSTSWNYPQNDCGLDRSRDGLYRNQYNNSSYYNQHYPSHHHSHHSSHRSNGLYLSSPADEHELRHSLNYPYQDDYLHEQLAMQQGSFLEEDLSAMSSYSLQAEQAVKQLRDQIINERKRRFTQAFAEADMPSQAPPSWGSHYHQVSGSGYSSHSASLGLDFLDAALKYEQLS